MTANPRDLPLRAHPSAWRSRYARRPRLASLTIAVLAMTCCGTVAAASKPDWDQVENIKDAATRLAQLQRTQGAQKAFEFIDACYRTHSLSTEYTRAFEACIAQDYMETQVLALIYSRVKPNALRTLGAPSPEALAKSMGRRVTAAFSNYKISPARAKVFKDLVDEHGFPLFFRALFPKAKMPVLKDGEPPAPEKKQ
jgi:hypothetical protein